MKERDRAIDFLRGFSIIIIVLIHVMSRTVSTPFLLSAFRNLHFAEVLLVFCSGAALAYNYTFKGIKDITSFIVKRIKRFYLPWWVFAAVFFTVHFIFDFVSGVPFRYNLSEIMSTFLVFGVGGGIGYGWILLLLLVISVLFPFISLLSEKIGYELVLAVFMVFSFIMHYLYSLNIITGIISNIFFLQFLLPFFIGIYYVKRKKLSFPALGLFFLMVYAALFFSYSGRGASTFFTDYKYPPNLFYMSYGVFISVFLAWIAKQQFSRKLIDNKTAIFFSRNSLWIYMWHILVLGLFYQVSVYIKLGSEPWIQGFIFVLGVSAIIVLIQNYITAKCARIWKNN